MRKQALEIRVNYRGYVKHSDATGLFLSWCPMLEIKSQGTTAAQARAALDDSVRLFVVHCFRRGILESTLSTMGLQEVEAVEDHEERISVRPIPVDDDNILDSWDGSVPVRLGTQIVHATAE
jgi:hypothetical protein